jgi:hypothetical protein
MNRSVGRGADRQVTDACGIRGKRTSMHVCNYSATVLVSIRLKNKNKNSKLTLETNEFRCSVALLCLWEMTSKIHWC